MPALPVAIPLPPLPEQDLLTSEQWGILSAIADTIIPSFTTSAGGNRLLQHPLRSEVWREAETRLERLIGAGVDEALVSSYLGESATSNTEFRASISRLVAYDMDNTARKKLTDILNVLNTRAGSLMLTGYATPLDCLPIQDRERVLQGWATSRIGILRGLQRTLASLTVVNWVRTSPTLGQVLGYPRVPTHSAPSQEGYPFRFLQMSASAATDPEVIETDVVIVGSGCGGAVAAKTLAESGLRVVVVDKAYYFSPSRMPMTELEGAAHLFEGGGAIQSDDSSTTVGAGSVWGGGGTVNWSASLQTQGIVRREWSEKFGLHHFTGAEYQRDQDAVCERMGVGVDAIEHNPANLHLLEGARKLGWSAKVVPQNTGGEAHNCGYCTLGCGSCGKKGPTETFLPDAARAGAEFIEGFECREVLFEDSATGERVASGVRGIWSGRDSSGLTVGPGRPTREVIIKAKRVVASAGTLSTPLLLMRSGLTNPHIGRHLHLHPVSFLAAVWDEDVRPWEGSILTAVVNEFENLDNKGYGPKLEATTAIPGICLPCFPWTSGLQMKEFAAKFKRMTGYISLARDRYGGRVYPSPDDGRIRIAYQPSTHDKNHILEGVVRLAELMYVQGAKELHTLIPGFEPFVRPSSHAHVIIRVTAIENPSVNDAEFKVWCNKLRSVGFPSMSSKFISAHQMGTCRMGISEKNSVVDADGKVWGTEGLYVCDASVFPSASGVNPMITNMGISRGVARGIANELAGYSTSAGAAAERAKL